jgi:hypothetical protein
MFFFVAAIIRLDAARQSHYLSALLSVRPIRAVREPD